MLYGVYPLKVITEAKIHEKYIKNKFCFFFIPNVNFINTLTFLKRFHLNFLDLLKNKVFCQSYQFQISLATRYQKVAMLLLTLPEQKTPKMQVSRKRCSVNLTLFLSFPGIFVKISHEFIYKISKQSVVVNSSNVTTNTALLWLIWQK